MGKGRLSDEPDYRRLIDADTWAYIEKLDATYPPGAVDLSVAEQRRVYDEMCQIFRQPRPAGVSVSDKVIGGVDCRHYSKGISSPTVVYFHGGGFVVGGLDSHDDVCAEICDRTGFDVVSVDYRLAPEAVFPAHFDDAWAAFAGVLETGAKPLVLCGDSAGGNLAAAVAHHARDKATSTVAGQVLFYPGLGGDQTKGSYVTHANAPQLTSADLVFYETVRRGEQSQPINDPRYAPLHDNDFSDLPPTVIITAECDPLASDGETYRDVIKAAGGRAIWFNEPGLVHGCLRARNMSQRARVLFDRAIDGIAALGAGQWPYDT